MKHFTDPEEIVTRKAAIGVDAAAIIIRYSASPATFCNQVGEIKWQSRLIRRWSST